MPDQSLVDNIRKENYTLQIFIAFGNNDNVITITTKLIQFIQEIYRSIEPSHYKGHLIIYSSIDDSLLLDDANAEKFFDRTILFNNTSDVIIIQFFQNGNLPLIWQNETAEDILNSDYAVTYSYKDSKECFYAKKNKIDINNPFNCASIYALHYHYLSEALQKYKQDKIRFSSCTIFYECWFDPSKRIYFKNKPEEIMQKSLKEYLSSSLRGIDIVREYNLGASKPVDIRVYWKEANRAALIEIKWLGQSKDENGDFATSYSNGRGNDGMTQLKEYKDLDNQDTPTCMTKSYLVIIDGRRKNLSKHPTTINTEDGMYYCNKEIMFDKDKKYYESIIGFEKPLRMFVEPICSL